MPMPMPSVGDCVPLVTSPILSTTRQNRVVWPRGRRFLRHLECNQFAANAVLFLLDQDISTDKRFLVKRDKFRAGRPQSVKSLP